MPRWIAALASLLIIVVAVVLIMRSQRDATTPSSAAPPGPAATSTTTAQNATAASTTAESRLETYTSPRYGYGFTYDTAIWDSLGMENNITANGHLDEADLLELDHRTLPVTLRIEGDDGTFGSSSVMSMCVRNELFAVQSFNSEEPLATPDSGGGDGRAWSVVEFEATDGRGRLAVYVECRWVSGVTLTIRHTAPAATYSETATLREAVLATLDAGGVQGDAATPAATPVATPLATPVASPAAIPIASSLVTPAA